MIKVLGAVSGLCAVSVLFLFWNVSSLRQDLGEAKEQCNTRIEQIGRAHQEAIRRVEAEIRAEEDAARTELQRALDAERTRRIEAAAQAEQNLDQYQRLLDSFNTPEESEWKSTHIPERLLHSDSPQS